MSELILFSVIIPTYNRADLVSKTIASLLEQTYKNFELIVVDDGSTDNTKEVIAAITDPRVKYFVKENAERGAARNFGFSKAMGNYINYFDSDDLAYPKHLQTAADLVSREKFPEIFHLGYDYKTEAGKVLHQFNRFNGNVVNYALKKKMISPISFFIRKDIAAQFPFSEDRQLIMGEDMLHLLHLVARFRLVYDNTITSSLIQHPQRSMSTSDATVILYCREQITAALKKDDVFMKVYGKYLAYVSDEYYYLACLDYLQHHDNKNARKYFMSYISSNAINIFSKRTLVFLKKYFYNLIA